MTLNITILTSKIIYQSADYRLFDTKTRRALSMPSTKAVILDEFEWTGFVTYTGVGRVGTKHTSEFVREWLQSDPPISFADAVEVIRINASSWIRKVAQGQKHTFVVAGFVDGDSTAAVVSNFQKWHVKDLDSVSENFSTSIVTVKRNPLVIVTGVRAAVPRDRRRALRRLAVNHFDDPARVRRALAEATHAGAQRYPDKISEDCFVYSQDRNGCGHMEVMGGSRTNPAALMSGTDVFGLARPILEKHFGPGNWSLKQAAFAISGDPSEPPPLCELRLSTRTQNGRYSIVQLASPSGRRATPRALNAHGIIVGSGTPRWHGPSYPCVWPEPTELKFLPHGGGNGGSANDINDSGAIVGASQMLDRTFHAHVWHLDEQALDIGQALGRNSAAQRINRAGSIVGWASIHPTKGGQEHQRPAWWPDAGSPTILEDLAGAWGMGLDINTNGRMVIDSHIGRSGGAWLWNGQDAYEIGKPGPEFRTFSPRCLTEDDAVVGLAIRSDGQRIAAVRNVNGSWAFLFAPSPGREFTAARGTQIIAGYDTIDHYRIPWVKRENEEATYLPHFQYHHHHPTMISEQGWVLGTASSDNCCHPLLWVPE